MGTPATKHGARHSTSGAIIESEDDDPGIRGLSPSPHQFHRLNHTHAAPAAAPLSTNTFTTPQTAFADPRSADASVAGAGPSSPVSPSSTPATPIYVRSKPRHRSSSSLAGDDFDVAIMNQNCDAAASPASKLDQFILGRTGVAPQVARGSMSKPGNAVSSSKGAFTCASAGAAGHNSRPNSSPNSSEPVDIAKHRAHTRDPHALASPPASSASSASPTAMLGWAASSASSSSSSSSSEGDMSPPSEPMTLTSRSNSIAPTYLSSSSLSAPDSSSRSPTSTSTTTTNSTNSSTRTSSTSSPSRPANEGISVKQSIKQVCVAGSQSHASRDAKFCSSSPQIREICRASREQFSSEPASSRLDGPIKVVGDIHGQFKDLMRSFKHSGMPPAQHYSFSGDYVDRGKQSLETFVSSSSSKSRYPDRVHMSRGNHESAGITKVYGFYDECKRRSSSKAWRAFVDVFNTSPVAGIVGERIFCVHGGISPSLTSSSQIEASQRPTDIPDAGFLADSSWSDPDPQVKEWSENDRGVSFCFGQRSLEWFCRKMDVDLVVRGHMVVEDGYEFFGGRRLVTVFSAPNYCGDFDNSAAIMNISDTSSCSFDVIESRKPRPSRRGSTPPKGFDRQAYSRPSAESKKRQTSPTQHELSKQRQQSAKEKKTSAVSV